MPYIFSAEGFHTKKLFSRLSSREVHFGEVKTVTFCSRAILEA